jgi:hypothetical protein
MKIGILNLDYQLVEVLCINWIEQENDYVIDQLLTIVKKPNHYVGNMYMISQYHFLNLIMSSILMKLPSLLIHIEHLVGQKEVIQLIEIQM